MNEGKTVPITNLIQYSGINSLKYQNKIYLKICVFIIIFKKIYSKSLFVPIFLLDSNLTSDKYKKHMIFTLQFIVQEKIISK